MRLTHPIIVAAFLFAVPHQGLAQDMTDDRVKELVAEALRENPELVLEALRALEQRQADAKAAAAEAVLTTERETLERDPNAPVIGKNRSGDRQCGLDPEEGRMSDHLAGCQFSSGCGGFLERRTAGLRGSR